MHVHALAAQDLGEQLGGLRFLGGDDAVGHLDDGHAGPEARHRLADLDADGTSADDEQRLRHRLGGDGLTVRPVRHAGEHGRHPGPGPRRQHERPPGRDGLPRDLDRRRPGDASPAADETPALALEALDRHRVVPRVRRLLTNAPGDGRPVRRHHRRAGHAGDATSLGQEVRGAHHHLGRDAAPVRALTTDQLRLDADDLETRLRQLAGDLLAARSQADDDDIGLHRGYSCPQLVSWTGATIGVPTTS